MSFCACVSRTNDHGGLASAPSQSDANVPHDDVTHHESLCVLHADVPSSTAHFRAARVAASHDPFETPQKKRRSHVVLPQPSDAPLLHQASHSGDVATLRAGTRASGIVAC